MSNSGYWRDVEKFWPHPDLIGKFKVRAGQIRDGYGRAPENRIFLAKRILSFFDAVSITTCAPAIKLQGKFDRGTATEWDYREFVQALFDGIKSTTSQGPKGKDIIIVLLAWMSHFHDPKARSFCDEVNEYFAKKAERKKFEKLKFRRFDTEGTNVPPRENSPPQKRDQAELSDEESSGAVAFGRSASEADLSSSSNWQPPEYKARTHFSDDEWLNAENPHAIPFVPRQDEFGRLDAFVRDDKGEFRIWAIVAPSGAGKTRLALEWMRNSDALDGWRKCILKPYQRSDDGWKDWQPDRPTLLVIDYIHGFEGFIKRLFDRFLHCELKHPLRLLILDHVFPENLGDIGELSLWGLGGAGASTTSRVRDVFHGTEPMWLDESDDLDRIIPDIISAVSGRELSHPSVVEGTEYLKNETGTWHPLFAALVGDAINRNIGESDYGCWDRRQLIRNYLQAKERRPWLDQTPEGMWASCLIVAATLCRGVSADLMMEVIPSAGELGTKDLPAILRRCNKVISSLDNFDVPAFEPDILGENFCLLFLKNERSPMVRDVLGKMLSIGHEKLQAKNAEAFTGAIVRLARNLANDDQSAEETRDYWRVLRGFLNPQYVKSSKAFRWAFASAGARVSRLLNEKKLDELAHSFSGNVIEDDLYTPPLELCSASNVTDALRYWRQLNDETACVPPTLGRLFERYERTRGADQVANLLIACAVGSASLVRYLIEHEADIDEIHAAGWNALMTASYFGQDATARELISYDPELNAATDSGWNALMIACRYGRQRIASMLIKNGAALNQLTENRESAVMISCNNGYESIAVELVANGANTAPTSRDGPPVLFLACYHGLTEVVSALIAKKTPLDYVWYAPSPFTALALAREQGHDAIVNMLEEAGASESRMTDIGD